MAFVKSLMRSRLARVTVLLALTTSSLAFSYWRAAGTGTAAATATTTAAVVIAPATAGAGLYPGGQADVLLTLANPNPFAVRVGTLSLDTSRGTAGFAVDAGHSGCDVSVLSLSMRTGPWPVGPRVGTIDGSTSVTLSDALTMTTTASSVCQGATFTVYLLAGP